ncbi:MAG TPA: hypothetical protein VEJ44_00880 [Acidimicrobiales bacterium]|nr:hypothetical protein [Acidimicrobiales bacterium]
MGALVASLQCFLSAPAAAQSGSPPITPAGFHATGLDPSPANPVRVWILGDSVMNQGSPALSAALGATGEAQVVADSSFGGWGLTTQSAWIADSLQIIDDYHPQVIVGTWSWDDPMAGRDPRLYAALLAQAIGVWMSPGDGVRLVVLVQFPQPGPDLLIPGSIQRLRDWIKVTAEQDTWDRIARSMTSVFPGRVVYLSTAQVFAPGGRFVTWIRTDSGWARTRQLDNAHLCVPGAIEFGQVVVSDLQSILGLNPPAPGWQDGAWTEDVRYQVGHYGPGVCPADAPPTADYNGVRVPDQGGSN